MDLSRKLLFNQLTHIEYGFWVIVVDILIPKQIPSIRIQRRGFVQRKM